MIAVIIVAISISNRNLSDVIYKYIFLTPFLSWIVRSRQKDLSWVSFQWFLIEVDFASPGDIWQCLEKSLVVTIVGEVLLTSSG